jgi:cytochrome c oxidase subunit 2
MEETSAKHMNFSNFPMAPPQASSFAQEHDLIFYALTGLTILFTLIVGVAVVYLSLKYRAGNKVDRSRPMYENLKLELTWTIVPTILGLIMFFFGARLFIEMRNPPKDAQEVFVIGKQWMWHVQHANGVRENNTLHVPIGKPIKLTMISQDVLHAFYIPAFRSQMFVVPGRYTSMWFKPTRIGEYHLFCTMYCGTQHSEMGGKVVVMDQRAWAEWSANGGESTTNMTMEQSGAKSFAKLGCNNCHGAEDSVRAPSLAAIFGKKRSLSDGSGRLADEEYLRESILRPHNVLTAGYEATMPAYDKQITEQDVLNLIAFIKNGGVLSPGLTPNNEISIANGIGAGTPTNSAAGQGPASPAVGALRSQAVKQ